MRIPQRGMISDEIALVKSRKPTFKEQRRVKVSILRDFLPVFDKVTLNEWACHSKARSLMVLLPDM
jgi:hypothetical protein